MDRPRETAREALHNMLLVRLREGGLIAEPLDLTEFRAFIVAEISRWKPMLEETGFVAP